MNIPEDIGGLKALVIQLIAENTELKKIIQVQADRIKELEKQLNANSENSSKPPSSDGYKKKPALSKDIIGTKGGQKGHTGQTLKQISNPDQTIILPLTTCNCCGGDLSQIQSVLSERRQVFNLPEPRLLSTEYQNQKVICPHCQSMQYSNFPLNVNAPVQYGDGVKAFVVLLSVGYKIPFKKIRLLFADLFHYPINESTITTASEICYQKLEETEKNIIEQIKTSFLAHLDETGMRIQGQLRWLHTVSTTLFTYLWVHIHRGTKALDSSKSILRQLKNWILHDCWTSYFQYRNVKHALCGAHILRELQALIENKSNWAKEFSALLLEIYYFRKLNPTQTKPEWSIRYDELCCIAHQEEPPPQNTGKQGKAKCSKGRNLLLRLAIHKDAVLAFAYHSGVPFTNNQAERDIRHVKLKQKISGSFRTFHGAEIYARIEGYVSSLRKNKFSIFKELTNVFTNKNYDFNLNT